MARTIRQVSLPFCCQFFALTFGIPLAAQSIEEPAVFDESIVAALEAKQRLEATDGHFVDVMERLQKALDEAIEVVPEQISASDFSNERRAILQLDRVLQQLITMSEPVLASQEDYLELGERFVRELKESGPAFKAAASQCRNRASAQRYDEFRGEYLIMADILDRMAERCDRTPSDISARIQAVSELFPYLTDSRTMLVHFREVIATIPVLETGRQFDELDDRLKAYVRAYESFRGSLRKLHERLQPAQAKVTTGNVVSLRFAPAASVPTLADSTPDLQYASWRPSGVRVREPNLFDDGPTLDGPPKEAPSPPPVFRDVVAFKTEVDAWQRHRNKDYRMAIINGLGTAVGDVIRVKLLSGEEVLVKVDAEVTAWRAKGQATWLAFLVQRQGGRATRSATETRR